MSTERIVITGMGQISPFGLTCEQLWDGLVSRSSAVRLIPEFPSDFPVSFGAPATEFTSDIENYGPLPKEMKKTIRKGMKIMSRETRMALAATQHALNSAGFEGPATDDGSVPVDGSHFNPDRSGIYFGSDYQITMPEDFANATLSSLDDNGGFDFDKWAENGLPKMNPLWLLIFLPNMPACHISMYNDVRGASNSVTQREASANLVLDHASHFLRNGWYDMMIVGSTGTRLNPLKAIHACKNEQMVSKEFESCPEKASRPFDASRTGQVLGEGAGTVILERESSAIARNVPILAEYVAGASSMAKRGFICNHPALEPEVQKIVENVLNVVLQRANLKPQDIDFIIPHGLSDPAADRGEAKAIARVFGENAVNVVTPKANFGNLGAGGSMVELIAGVEALNHGELFPALNYETADSECPVRVVTEPGVPAGKTFIKISFSPQGQASAAVIRKI